MRAASVLGSLPRTFATAQYRDEAGVAASSASRALRALAERGQVRSLGRGWWYQPFVGGGASPPLLAPPPWLWSPDLECLLDSLFAAAPRRLGYLTALDAAGVPATAAPTLATTGRASARVVSAGLVHVREPEAVFALAARQFTERTAVSEPDRALLECAQFPHHAPRWEEYVGYAVCWGGGDFSPERVQALSDLLGWRAGLRRIASIAAGLADTEPVGDLAVCPTPGWAEMEAAPRRGDRWLSLTGRPADAAAGFVDAERRVAWWTTPDALARQIAG